MGALVSLRLPMWAFLVAGGVLVAGHNAFDFMEAAPGFSSTFWWDVLHYGQFTVHQIFPGHNVILVYAFPVWLGVMMLGYAMGSWYASGYDALRRKKNLMYTGLTLLVFFVLLRFSNWYGDPVDWAVQRTPFYTFLSFINVDKYPASLLYLSLMLGPALILLSLTEKIENKLTQALTVFGRTAFFYYIIHLYLIHAIAVVVFFMRGHTYAEVYDPKSYFPFLYVVPGEGYGLPMVYLLWILVITLLYPLCKWYNCYKSLHKEKWWLSYL